MRRRTKWFLGSAVGVLAIFVLLVAIGSQLPAPPSSSAQAMIVPATAAPADAHPTPTGPKPIQVTSDELDQAFADNEIAATSRFAARPLVVTGSIKKISEVTEFLHSNSAALDLDGKDTMSTVSAFLPHKNDAIHFKPGDVATLHCASVVKGWLGLALYDCASAKGQTS